MEKPLLSVVIANKNREKYCIEAIKAILNYEDSRVEITIADNSNTTAVQDFVDQLDAPSVKYKYNPAEISSIDNFNAALELATGEYIMLIGDDDAILPSAISTAEWAKQNNVDSICSKETVIYYWPDSCEQYKTGFLSFPFTTGKKTEINLQNELNKLLEHGLQHYLLYPLPKTYHGIVKREIMEKIKAKTGHFYGGLSPDIYSCVAVSCVAKNHYQIDLPLSVAGVCSVSTTADNIKGTHSGTLEGIPHLKNRGNYIWDEEVPKYYSVNTIWAESGLKALHDLNRKDLLAKFNPYFLLAMAKINNFKFIPEIITSEHQKYRTSRNLSKVEFATSFYRAYVNIIFKKIHTILKSKSSANSTFRKDNVVNIQKAINIYRTESK